MGASQSQPARRRERDRVRDQASRNDSERGRGGVRSPRRRNSAGGSGSGTTNGSASASASVSASAASSDIRPHAPLCDPVSERELRDSLPRDFGHRSQSHSNSTETSTSTATASRVCLNPHSPRHTSHSHSHSPSHSHSQTQSQAHMRSHYNPPSSSQSQSASHTPPLLRRAPMRLSPREHDHDLALEQEAQSCPTEPQRRRRPLSLQPSPRTPFSSVPSTETQTASGTGPPPPPRRVHLAHRISSLIRRSGRDAGGGIDLDDDDANTAKRERSASSSVHHPSPGRPVQKRRRVGGEGMPEDEGDDCGDEDEYQIGEDSEQGLGQRSHSHRHGKQRHEGLDCAGLDLDLAGSGPGSSSPASAPVGRRLVETYYSPSDPSTSASTSTMPTAQRSSRFREPSARWRYREPAPSSFHPYSEYSSSRLPPAATPPSQSTTSTSMSIPPETSAGTSTRVAAGSGSGPGSAASAAFATSASTSSVPELVPTPDSAPSPTDELLADRLRTISTIRDALGPDWTPASSTSSLAPVERLLARFRRPNQRTAMDRTSSASTSASASMRGSTRGRADNRSDRSESTRGGDQEFNTLSTLGRSHRNHSRDLGASTSSDGFLRPPTPSLSSGSTGAASASSSWPTPTGTPVPPPQPPTQTQTQSSSTSTTRSLGHRLSAIMGFASPSRNDEWEEQPPSRTASTATFGPGAAAAPLPPPAAEDTSPSSGDDPARIPVGAVLVIQGLAQTHANIDESVDQGGTAGSGSGGSGLGSASGSGSGSAGGAASGSGAASTRRRAMSEAAIDLTRTGPATPAAAAPPPRARIDVASLDQQARMIGNLLTVAAAATATTLLSPTSLVAQTNTRSTAHSAMQTILERFRPQRSRASQSIESTLGEYLRTVLRDNRRFAEAVAGDATSGNIPSEFQDFLQTLQQDLILAVRAYAVPDDEEEAGDDSAVSSASETLNASNAGSAMDQDEHEHAEDLALSRENTPTRTTAPAAGSNAIPTFHRQRGQNLPGGGASRLGVSGGVDGVPRRLNFFRAHLFPSVSNGGDRAADDDANAVVPSIFVGVRSVTHDPSMTTEDLVSHPGFPFLDGQVPDGVPGGGLGDDFDLGGDRDRDTDREITSTTPPTFPSSLPNSFAPTASPASASGSTSAAAPTLASSPRRTLRDRVRERFTPRREQRPHPPLNTYLIYVIGGNYPRSHPVLAIPSLVSGGPLSAEDLALVSELLGPAKPPTASADEINRSGLAVVTGKDMREMVANGNILEASLDRCMVCLSDYEAEEECRILKCRHAFHKECVDHWLSQGRNSCPACRTEAVDKTALGSTGAAVANGADTPADAEMESVDTAPPAPAAAF